MKILVTGGAGFIGSHIVDAYVNLGHEVVIVDNLVSGEKKNVNKKAKFYNADICNEGKIDSIFKKEKPEIVSHLAAQKDVGFSVVNPIEDARINVIGSLIILQNCIKYGTRKIIYSNTGGALYGSVPLSELPIKEDRRITPPNQYGLNKSIFELYLRMYNREMGIDFVSLRYSNVYGERQKGGEAGVIPIFIKKMLAGETPAINGDGKQTRDFIYVGDVVKANILALQKTPSKIYNVSSGRQVSILHLYKIIARELNFNKPPKFSEAKPGEVRFSALSYSRINKELGWKPEVSFEDGIKRTINYIKSNSK